MYVCIYTILICYMIQITTKYSDQYHINAATLEQTESSPIELVAKHSEQTAPLRAYQGSDHRFDSKRSAYGPSRPEGPRLEDREELLPLVTLS